MIDDTLYVDPGSVRATGSKLARLGERLRGDVGTAMAAPPPSDDWAVVRAADTLGKLWRDYLSGLGTALGECGDRLGLVADAYERCDTEAAEALVRW